MDGDADISDSRDEMTGNRKQKVPGSRPALKVESGIGLVAVVIVVVPIAI
jgi:hypothetical protein